MNNTVLPSSLLDFADNEYFGSFANAFANTALRIGMVKQTWKIEDKENENKGMYEYDVLTFQQDKDKGVVPITYKNCVTMDRFGGVADFFEYTQSAPTDKKITNVDTDDGSYVLILCIDGTQTRGVILGALKHHNRKSTLTKLSGKHMEGEFNGLRMKVNSDGEMTMTFKGKTDTKGKPVTAKNGGSQFKFEKDGSVEFNDRELDGELKSGNDTKANDTSKAPADYDKIRIDKTNQAIETKSRKNTTMTVGKDLTQTVKGNTSLTTTDLLVKASGKASYDVGATFDITAKGEVSLKAPAGKFAFDNAMQVQASSIDFNAQAINVGPGGTPALIISTQFIGIGNLGAPVISTPMGPFSATVFIAP
jgi:hypothetical protein